MVRGLLGGACVALAYPVLLVVVATPMGHWEVLADPVTQVAAITMVVVAPLIGVALQLNPP